ncbi:hypothetical protein J8I87_12010 [Paraburkholderia sp. LEh10]|uniref:shikimate dehydrogenase family protein n=1 Tax=Paraburkholderia sp. LEh10 TaxID=2821353 RepID=UPI001AE8B02A|nr:hypothetical protein [Paraburkholderia sp. LEh10]MBP0590426.1 hypothetical protein [Paraburkholderia sp. LEh10]
MVEEFEQRRLKALNAQITGSTKLVGIVGTPVDQLKSPGVWNPLFERYSVDAAFLPFDVPTEAFDRVMSGLKALSNIRGLMITMPHKFAAVRHADKLSSQSKHIGAISMMRRSSDGSWIGDSCEAQAVLTALGKTTFEPKGVDAFLIGAGGAGQVIAWALALAGAASVVIHDVNRGRAEDLARRISSSTSCRASYGENDPSQCDLVINATPTGMSELDPLPTDVERFAKSAIVLDMIADPSPTRFLQHASLRGHQIVDGLTVLQATVPVFAEFLGLGSGWDR